MYEYLKHYIERSSKNNMFYKVNDQDIKDAENRMKLSLPDCIKIFYKEVGYGFLMGDKNYINRIMAPDDIADYVCNENIYEYVDKSIYEENELVFMHISDEDFLTIIYKGEDEGKILYFGQKIAESFEEFIKKMCSSPNYYI